MVKPKHVFILVAAVAAMAVFFTMRGDTGAERAELAERMILIENEPEYVTTFTTLLLAAAATEAIRQDMTASRLPEARLKAIHADFDKVTPRNPHTNEAYLLLSILHGGALGALLFSDSDNQITMSDALVELCGEDREMLVGLLLHEIAHRDLKHSRIRLIGAALPEDRPDLIDEDFERVAESYHAHPERLLGFPFGATMETAAREHAHARLRGLGIATDGFERCLTVLEDNRKMAGVELFLKAHALPGDGAIEAVPRAEADQP